MAPSTQREVKNSEQTVVQAYIQKVEQHTTQKNTKEIYINTQKMIYAI